MYRRVKFTSEWEIGGRLNYLDVTLIKKEGMIITKWYRKPISKDLLINNYSWHPKRYKENTMNNLMLRAMRLTTKELLSGVRSRIYRILKANWYPIDIIDRKWKKCESIVYGKENRCKKQLNERVIQNIEYRSLDYVEGLSECINSIFINQGFCKLRLSYKPVNKIASFVHSMKDPIDIEKNKDLVYKVSCRDCSCVYIGHTSMWLSKLMYHHKMNAKPGTKTNTALSMHCLKNQHMGDWENVEVLHTERKLEKRKILESIYIHKNIENTMNDRNEIGVIGSTFAALID